MKFLDAIKNTNFAIGHDFDTNKTCSIVGNSGVILDSKNGNNIDSNEDIIRFNAAKTIGFEGDVGSRTTYRILNCHFILNIDNQKYFETQKSRFPEIDRYFLYNLRNENIIFKTDPSWRLWKKKEILNKVEKYNNVFFVSDDFYNLSKRFNRGKEASNGFLGLLFALKYYKKIECFGFSFYDNKYQKHYYENVNTDPSNNHNFEMEKKIFNLFHKNKIIKLY